MLLALLFAVPTSSAATLTPSPYLLDPEPVGYVSLFGFVVSPELSEVVNSLMSEARVFTRNSICLYMSRRVSNYSISNSEQQLGF